MKYPSNICYVPDDNRPLVVASKLRSVQAYNPVNNKLEWSTSDRSYSVTTDGRNYVLICSPYDDHIKVRSPSDGKDLGCLIRKGDQGLGELWYAGWCKSSSLVVLHKVAQEFHISHIQFE